MDKKNKKIIAFLPGSLISIIRLKLILLLSSLVFSSLVDSASIIVQELDKTALDTNSIHQQQQQTNLQIALNIDQVLTSTIEEAKFVPTVNQQQVSPISNNNDHKPMSNMKAEKLLKGLSSFMSPSLNPAAYFVPNSPSQSMLKSQHQKESGSRKSMMQKTDNNNTNSNNNNNPNVNGNQLASSISGGQQQMSAEPSALVNIQTTGEGIVNAPTRMARPQNYIFRWGRR